jgi:hypothetical protein
MLPVGILRMAGFPVELMHQFRINCESLEDFRKQTKRVREAMRHLFLTREDIQEAIWISSRENYNILSKNFKSDFNDKRNKISRSNERLFTKYLMRFCYKNDTTSFFGPSVNINMYPEKEMSLEGVLSDDVSDRENCMVYPSTWAGKVPEDLVEVYRKARGVEKRNPLLEEIIRKTEGSRPNSSWRWYSELTPIYELCNAKANYSVGGKLIKEIENKSRKLFEKVMIFSSMMYKKAVDAGYYDAVYKSISDMTKSKNLEKWIRFIYSTELTPELKEIRKDMIAHGKVLFRKVFLENYEEELYLKHYMPYAFSPDIMIESKSVEDINRGNYKLIVCDVHCALSSMTKTFHSSMTEEQIKTVSKIVNHMVFDKISFYNNPPLSKMHLPESFNTINDTSDISLDNAGGEIVYNKKNSYVEFFFSDVLSKIIPLGLFGLGEFLPDSKERIELDGMIIKRQSKKILSKDYLSFVKDDSEDKMKKWFHLFKQTKEYFKVLSFSNVIFIKPDCEYKPLAIDLNNPFCCEILERYAKKSNFILVQEMAPDEEHLWLKNSKGRYVSEIRISLLREAD